ncbi:hypothetical protein ACFL0X_00735 [Nanoarchaeota archaeon]
MKKISSSLKLHLVDTTAMLSASNPIYSGFEVFFAGMNNMVSINARGIASGLAYLGLGSLFARGRDLSRRLFRVTDRTRERIQYLHDMGYTATMNLLLAPPIYLASGETDIKKIAMGTGIAMAFSTVTGWPMGYAVDNFRDLIGLQESERVSNKIREQSPSVKKGLAALVTAGSVGLMAGIYALNQ